MFILIHISPGAWYFGLFNGIGSMRTQSKMINRGSGYSFSGNVTVEGCMSPSISGQFCNETIDHLSCVDQNSTQGIVTSCKNDGERSCIHQNESKLYSLDILGVTEEITISATNVIFNQSQRSNGANNDSNIILMCYARHGSISSPSTHDYSGNINNAPLVIRSPKVGQWYITVTTLNVSKEIAGSTDVCYSLEWKLLQCPINKAGLNCTWERYTLQVR
ncbi:putative Atu1913-like superfamily protein [Helianthus debilis subsp. tardiflorus]